MEVICRYYSSGIIISLPKRANSPKLTHRVILIGTIVLAERVSQGPNNSREMVVLSHQCGQLVGGFRIRDRESNATLELSGRLNEDIWGVGGGSIPGPECCQSKLK